MYASDSDDTIEDDFIRSLVLEEDERNTKPKGEKDKSTENDILRFTDLFKAEETVEVGLKERLTDLQADSSRNSIYAIKLESNANLLSEETQLIPIESPLNSPKDIFDMKEFSCVILTNNFDSDNANKIADKNNRMDDKTINSDSTNACIQLSLNSKTDEQTSYNLVLEENDKSINTNNLKENYSSNLSEVNYSFGHLKKNSAEIGINLNDSANTKSQTLKSKLSKDMLTKVPAFDLSFEDIELKDADNEIGVKHFENTELEPAEDFHFFAISDDENLDPMLKNCDDECKETIKNPEANVFVYTKTLEDENSNIGSIKDTSPEKEKKIIESSDEVRNFIAISDNLEIIEKFALKSEISREESKVKIPDQIGININEPLKVDKLDFDYIDESIPFESLEEAGKEKLLNGLFDHEIKEVIEIKQGLSILSLTLNSSSINRKNIL